MTIESKPIKLADIPDDIELFRGSRIRLINDGRNLHPDDKYFDYLLSLSPWDKDFMFLVNITIDSHKAGAFYATKIPIDKSSNKIIVTKGDLKTALGEDFTNCYLISTA